jgi:hypothetical protein
MDANYVFHTKSVQLKTEPKFRASLTAAVWHTVQFNLLCVHALQCNTKDSHCGKLQM